MKITGITKQGFHYSVDDAVGDDWELIEILLKNFYEMPNMKD